MEFHEDKRSGEAPTFPAAPYEKVGDYFQSYLKTLYDVGMHLNTKELENAVFLIEKCIKEEGVIYAFGNGGSAAIANHLQCDFSKGIATLTGLRPKINSLSSEICTVTAIGNDIGYDEIFAYQLRDRLESRDLVVAISSSGSSPNIVRALEVAREEGVPSILFCGFKGGTAQPLATASIYYPVSNYGIVEDLHQLTMHLIAQYIRMKNLTLKDSQIATIRF